MAQPAQVDWSTLRHAYGAAVDIPELLAAVATDTRPGHIQGSTWFKLWSALCHQGDAYSASYAAVPVLIEIASSPAYRDRYDPLLLAASINVSLCEGHGPSMPTALAESYSAALARGGDLARKALANPRDVDSKRAFEGCVEAFKGRCDHAQKIWDADNDGAV